MDGAAGMTGAGAGGASKAYYSNGPAKSASPMSKNRRGAAVRMLTNAGKTASAKGTSAMMSARRSKKVDKMKVVMGEFKKGQLHSGSDEGPKVTNRKQAIAIGISEQKKYNS